MTTKEQYRKLIDEFKKKSAKRTATGGGGATDLLNALGKEDEAVFSGAFCYGAVEADVLTDQVSATNLMPSKVLDLIMREDKMVQPEVLPVAREFGTADASAPSMSCSRQIKLSLTLRVRHGS